MKKLILIFMASALLSIVSYAQQTNYIYYQALLRSNGSSIVNDVNLKIGIILDDNTTVYEETQTVTPTSNGKINVFIGSGTKTSTGVDFGDIDWGKGKYSVKIDYDLNQDGNYTVTGTSELGSVPLANYSKKSRGLVTLTSDEIQNLTPVAGQMAFNTDDQVIVIFDGDIWRTVVLK